MGESKLIYVACVIPSAIDFIQVATSNKQEIDLVLLFVSLVCSIVGSTVQVAHKNLEAKILIKEVLAIYATAFIVTIIGYGAGIYINGTYIKKMFWVAVITAIVSYMSLDLFNMVRISSINIVSWIPEAFKIFVKSKYNLKDNDESTSDNNDYTDESNNDKSDSDYI